MKRDKEEDLEPISEWMQADPPPFGEEDLTAVRRGVWREIEAGRRLEGAFRPGRLPSALALGAAVAAVLVAVIWLRPRPEAPVAAAPASAPATVAAEATVVPPSPFAAPTVSAPRRSSPLRARVPAAGVVPVKIEFQTANPNVRIIWLARKGDTAPVASRTEEVS